MEKTGREKPQRFTFNRTNVELKYAGKTRKSSGNNSFNRTNVELKLFRQR